MNEDAHIIDIDSIVLVGVNPQHADRLRASVEAELQRVLGETGFSAFSDVAVNGQSVAGEIVRSVTQAVRGGLMQGPLAATKEGSVAI